MRLCSIALGPDRAQAATRDLASVCASVEEKLTLKQKPYRGALVILIISWVLVACGQSEPLATATPTLTAQLAEGKRLFSQNCGSCHAIEPETVIVGPSLFGVSDRATERAPQMTAQEYVEFSILQPQALIVPSFDDVMPSDFGKRLEGEELDAIVAYVLSLH